jgi:EmrB/QacA subfamily drug resistance transporter
VTTSTPTSNPAPAASFLASRRGKLVLALLCAVAFLDFLDASIVNVALPTIRHDLHFSVQNLQWVLSGYLLTYGGLLLLGGRMADLLGRRRVLVGGTVVFALSSFAAGLAPTAGVLVGARLAQGIGAALMSPAALSILTTNFNQGTDRVKALGAWGAMAGISSAAGVFLGGLLAGGPGWRWVFFVNLPVCALIVPASFRLIGGEHHRAPLRNFDTSGAVLVTAAMLLLVYTLIRVPVEGWAAAETLAGLSGAGVLFATFVGHEQRHSNPLVPLSIFRIEGLAAADVTQVIAMAGFYSMFFFLTLYMQTVLHYSPIRAGAAYLPVATGVSVSAGIGSKLIERTGTRPLIVGGALVSAGAVYWLSKIPVDGSYVSDLLGPLVIMSFGLGAVFVGVQTAAQAGVPPETAGLAAALINASLQVGAALGLAILTVIATSHTQHLVAQHVSRAAASTAGFQRALFVSGLFLAGAALIATRAPNTRGEPIVHQDVAGTEPVYEVLAVAADGADRP